MIRPSFTLKAVALAPYCAITTVQTTLLRSLNVLLLRVKIRKRGTVVPFNYVLPVVQLCSSTFTCRASCTCAVFKIIWDLKNLLRNLVSLSVHSKIQLWLFFLVSSHYACGISGWTTQPSVLSLTSCRHSNSRCGLVTQWLQTLIQPYHSFRVNENFQVTFRALLCLSVAVSLRGEWELSSDLQSFEFCLAALTPPRSLRTGRRERKG